MQYIFAILIFFFLGFHPALAAIAPVPQDVLMSVDQSVYMPSNVGIKDLTFEVVMNDGNEALFKHPALGGKRPVFTYLWRNDGKIATRALNIPDSPAELFALKERARSITEANGRYAAMSPISDNYMGWTFNGKREKGNYVITAIDKEKRIPPHLLYVNSANQLLRLTVDPGKGTFITHDYKYLKEAGKNLVSEILTTSFQNKKPIQTSKIVYQYTKVEGYSLPSMVTVDVTQRGKTFRETIRFGNYKINTGLKDELFLEN